MQSEELSMVALSGEEDSDEPQCPQPTVSGKGEPGATPPKRRRLMLSGVLNMECKSVNKVKTSKVGDGATKTAANKGIEPNEAKGETEKSEQSTSTEQSGSGNVSSAKDNVDKTSKCGMGHALQMKSPEVKKEDVKASQSGPPAVKQDVQKKKEPEKLASSSIIGKIQVRSVRQLNQRVAEVRGLPIEGDGNRRQLSSARFFSERKAETRKDEATGEAFEVKNVGARIIDGTATHGVQLKRKLQRERLRRQQP